MPSVLLRAALAAGRPGEDRLPGLQALLDLGLVGQVSGACACVFCMRVLLPWDLGWVVET